MLNVLNQEQAKKFVTDLPFNQSDTAENVGTTTSLLNGVIHGRIKSEIVLLKLTAYKNQRKILELVTDNMDLHRKLKQIV